MKNALKGSCGVFRWRAFVVCLCGLGLLLTLANRVPEFQRPERSWDQSNSLKANLKLLSKEGHLWGPSSPDFSRLLLPSPGGRVIEEDALSLRSALPDCLYNRPPPVV